MFRRIGKNLPQSANSYRVLVVDDQEYTRELFKEALNGMGHEVVCAQSGSRAIELIKDGKFDIVFLDLVMPEMDGVETFKVIKELNPELPVIMMTAFALESRIKEALELGALDYLYKPYDISKGREVIDKGFRKANLRLVRTNEDEV
jgi:CheY-like chemotaxis protein